MTKSSVGQRLVIKLGSSLLARSDHLLDKRFVSRIARSIADLHTNGHSVVVVSSGAVASGRSRLPHISGRTDIPARQILAAIGQPRLMQAYEQAFDRYGITVAQALLTRGDVASRSGYLSARGTLLALLDHRVVPIVNENDVVADEELRFGDNDRLSSIVAALIDADILLLLSDVSGLFTGDPRHDSQAQPIHHVTRVDEKIMALARPSSSGVGTGGMVTKLQAARLATEAGVSTVIAAGRERKVIERIMAGEDIGTRFAAGPRSHARRRWLHARLGARGTLVIDDGAVAALRQGGSSLLPAGVCEVRGHFQRGDPVDVESLEGQLLAHGLTNYEAGDLIRLQGRRSSEIASLLGYHYGDEVVHRNNLVLL